MKKVSLYFDFSHRENESEIASYHILKSDKSYLVPPTSWDTINNFISSLEKENNCSIFEQYRSDSYINVMSFNFIFPPDNKNLKTKLLFLEESKKKIENLFQKIESMSYLT